MRAGRSVGAFLAAQQRVGVAGQLFKAHVADREAEVARRHLFQLVRLVEDHGGGLGQNAGIGRAGGLALDGEVGEEEVVVDDDDVRLEGAAPHLGDEAAAVVGTGCAEAGFGARVELVPEGARLGQAGKLGAVAGFGGLLPLGDLVVLVDLFQARQNGLVAQGDELVAAEVVGAALHVADAQLAEQRFEKGNVAEVELILQGLGSGGDDDALAGAQGGQQVGQGFAGAGAGLDDQMAALGEGALDGLGHLELAGAVLVGQRRARQNAARREELVERGQGAGWVVGGGHRSGRSLHHSDTGRVGQRGSGVSRAARVLAGLVNQRKTDFSSDFQGQIS